jgi:hypothetical protein
MTMVLVLLAPLQPTQWRGLTSQGQILTQTLFAGQMDVPKLTQTRFAVQQGVASLSRKTANAELNLEQELELAQEPEQELELAQEPELDPRNNIQELGLHLLQLLMARTLRIAPTLTALGVRIARTQDTLTAHGAITAPGALVQEEHG